MALRVGTRGSTLALRQTQEAIEALARCGVAAQAVVCTTGGDRDQRSSLTLIGGQGIFVRELEQQLLAGRIDLVVHSAKDVPTELTSGAGTLAFLPRADARDVLVSRDKCALDELSAGARIGSSSRRRTAQLRWLRRDLDFADIRGNIDTRLAKLERGEYDAIVLAAAGLDRLGRLDVATEIFPIDVMLPAPGQGAIALQPRDDEPATLALLRRVDHAPTAVAVRAERAFLAALGAGCTLPVAAAAYVRGETVTLDGLVLDQHGERRIGAQGSGAAADAETVGATLARTLMARGADALLRELVS